MNRPAAADGSPASASPERGTPPLVRPVGDRGLLVELPTAGRTEALHAELLRRRAAGTLPPVSEIVPGATTVLLDGLPSAQAARRLAAELPGWDVPPLSGGAENAVEIPVRYDGPDLADVAALWGVSEDEVARIHAATTFRVAFCGFAPGFGYLTGLEERYHVPRRSDPRTRVPAGAVGLAGPYTGVYPRSSPGGWQLIGTAPGTVLWDPDRTPAALLAPGTRVRFVPLGDGGTDGDGDAEDDGGVKGDGGADGDGTAGASGAPRTPNPKERP
ncbi:allophanate hydrolase subunit 1 [Streptomyces albus]|uniref:Allophanate hydrolase subunit 1 n=2 Tax=Streptomyces albus TaxID=1888 RepID=A0A6C1C157_9ACTN|nr:MULTISPECIES: allophanate hydrolase subunit 1 [Streptomyces]EPD95663.1 TIGR00370 family protein [Streptomyces sp. HPH0547]MDI6407868.1 allophanate hydrolase subunit 1 [Streptomyces albus]QID36159.1 allophanate hydrolase subunit 1 [Streptomyces albus]TGG83244.1 allophanate hydrolase subunit 1 [Streptomyces albus]UVN57017.1 allophanate hydrolase subunit 1 [Streptomyces albus]